LDWIATWGISREIAIFVQRFTVIIKDSIVAEDVGIGAIGEEGARGDVISCQLFDDIGEDEANDGSQDLAAVGAGLLRLQQPVLEE
jgi:hypothetical protein